MASSRLLERSAWLVLAGIVWVTGCASAPQPLWVEAMGIGAMPPWRREGEAHVLARNAAAREARENLLRLLCNEKVGGDVTLREIARLDRVFESKLLAMIAGLKAEEVPGQPRGIVLVKVRVDKNQVLALAGKYLPKVSTPTAPAVPAAIPAPTATPAPAAPSAQPQEPPNQSERTPTTPSAQTQPEQRKTPRDTVSPGSSDTRPPPRTP